MAPRVLGYASIVTDSFSVDDPTPEPGEKTGPIAVPPPVLDPPVLDPSEDDSFDAASDPATPPAGTVVVPMSGSAARTTPATPWILPFRRKVMAVLERKGAGSATLVVVAVVLAAVGAMCISIQHHGFGALLGLAAVAAGWLARTRPALSEEGGLPPEGLSDPARPFVLAVSEVIPALLVGGLVLDQAGVPFHALVRTALLAGLLLLPAFRALDQGRTFPRGTVVVSWAGRLTLLLVGLLLGNPKLIVLLVAIVVATDLLVRLALIRPRNPSTPALPPGVASCFGADGAILTPIRWGILAVSVLLCLVFGTEAGWRF